MTTEVTNAKAMVEIMRRHYLPETKEPAGIFAPEIMAPTSSRRADLIWQGVTASNRELIGHEIKVSRADPVCRSARRVPESEVWRMHTAIVDDLLRLADEGWNWINYVTLPNYCKVP